MVFKIFDFFRKKRITLKNRDFKVELVSGALIQILYELAKHRLAFLPSINLRAYDEEAEIYDSDAMSAGIVEEYITRFPIRFGYSTYETKSSHEYPFYHVAVGHHLNCRTPAHSLFLQLYLLILF